MCSTSFISVMMIVYYYYPFNYSNYYYYDFHFMIFCFVAILSHFYMYCLPMSPVVRTTLVSSLASCVKLRDLVLDDAPFFLPRNTIAANMELFSSVCLNWPSPVTQETYRSAQMAASAHISRTRQVHVVCQPHGQSEHKRALPLHLVTRPAPATRGFRPDNAPLLSSAIESQCVI